MSKEDSSQVSRRGFLAATGAAATGISGCMGNDRSESTGTSAEDVPTPPSTETSSSAQTSTSESNGQNQDSNGEEIDIPHWKDADDLYETQKFLYKGAERLSDQCAFTVDPDYIDGSELEPTNYEGEPTLEHKLKEVLDGNVEYRGEMEELTVVVQKPDGHGNSSIHVYNDSGRAANAAATDSSIESQIDALEHVDAEGVEHSSDLLEYVERELN
jgi:hypothetical protein